MEDPYQILGISPDASVEEIKLAYHNKVREFHPDLVVARALHPSGSVVNPKTDDGEVPGSKFETPPPPAYCGRDSDAWETVEEVELDPELVSKASEKFFAIAEAFDRLRDPAQRALYDSINGKALSQDRLRCLLGQLKRNARMEVANMPEIYRKNLDTEMKRMPRFGLIILKALYGDLTCRHKFGKIVPCDVGRVLDVTMALQCEVANSELLISERLKENVPGFYDPASELSSNEKQVYIIYKYGERVYETWFAGNEILKIPQPGDPVLHPSLDENNSINSLTERQIILKANYKRGFDRWFKRARTVVFLSSMIAGIIYHKVSKKTE